MILRVPVLGLGFHWKAVPLESDVVQADALGSTTKALEPWDHRYGLLLADGLACDPSDLIAEGEQSSRRGRSLH